MGAVDEQQLERRTVELLAGRAPTSSICPSDVARDVGTSGGWRALMEPVRRAAARLAAAGVVEVTQGGRVVDVTSARGPVRIRRGPRFEPPTESS